MSIENNGNKQNIEQETENKSWLRNCWVKTQPTVLLRLFCVIFCFILIFVLIVISLFINLEKNQKLDSKKIAHVKVKQMNVERYLPFLITLKNGKVLIYDGEDTLNIYRHLKEQKYNSKYTYPEIFNPKTKSFKKLPILGYKLGQIYYELKNGNLLFFNDCQVTLFDINNEKFQKISDGISEIKETKKIANPLMFNLDLVPYSDNYIFISTIGTRLNDYTHKNKTEPEWIIKYNLITNEYEKVDIETKAKFIKSIVISKKEILFISEKDKEIYIYDTELNKFYKKGELLFKDNIISLRKVSNNKILILSPAGKQPSQMITLSPFKVDVLEKFNIPEKVFYLNRNGDIQTNDYLIFSSGLMFDKQNNKFEQVFIPQKQGCITKLDDEQFLIVGSSEIKIPTKTAEIIKFKRKR